MIEIMIDGKTVNVEKGTTILKAAKDNGFNIPTLCSHDGPCSGRKLQALFCGNRRQGTKKNSGFLYVSDHRKLIR